MKPSLSIVIPVYNAEKYIDQCFETILRQGLDNDDFEVIVVNDGSTDSSVERCERWSSRIPNLQIISQANQGAGAARNHGISVAKGDYLYLFDCDDGLADQALATLLKRSQSSHLDVLFFGGKIVYENSKVQQTNPQGAHYFERRQNPEIMKGEELFVLQQQTGNFCAQPCMLMSRLGYINRYNIRFAEGIINEDNLFVLRATLYAERADTDQEQYYRYYVHANSVTTTNTSGTQRCVAHLYLASCFEQERQLALSRERPEVAQAIDSLICWFLDIVHESRPASLSELEQTVNESFPAISLSLRLLEATWREREATQRAEKRCAELEQSTTWRVGRIATIVPRSIKKLLHRVKQ